MDWGASQSMTAAVIEEVDRRAGLMRAISDTLRSNPEIALQEHFAAEYLAELMEDNGFRVEREYCGLPTSFKAQMNGSTSGPTVCLIAEYDALPDIGHGCGHNLIAASTVGAGLALAKVIGDLQGSLVVVGAPAEEAVGGKAILGDRGGFAGMDAALIAHPAAENVVRHRSLAWQPFRLTFHGRPSHAAACPEKGVNALNALIETFNSINAIRQHVTGDVRIHGIITKGGVAPNIVPDLASGEFLVRAKDRKTLDDVLNKVRKCAEGAAMATGATLDYEATGMAYEAMKNNAPLEEALVRNMKAVGMEACIDKQRHGLGSTDVGNVSHIIPTAHPFYSVAPDCPPSHSREFEQVCGTDYAFEQTLKMAKAMALTGLDLFTDPGLLDAVKKDFEASGNHA